MRWRNHDRDGVVPALVLSDSLLVLHHGGVGIIRSLGRMQVPVYTVVKDRFTPAAVSRYVAGTFISKACGLDPPKLLAGMATIGERLKRPTVVIATDDVSAIFLAEHASALQERFLLPAQPASLPRTLANKWELHRLCKRIGVPCPETVFPRSRAEVDEFVESAGFPIVVKAAESWLLPRGEYTTVIACNRDQLYAIYRVGQSGREPNLLIQEYIPPACGEDWFYHGYRNTRSNCSIGFTGRKLRSYPAHAGPTTLGKAVVNHVLIRQTEALLEAISYSGIMDLDYRFDKRDGQYKLVDFNPRIGSQFRIFEDHAGVDVARALYLDLTGNGVRQSRPVEGRTFIVEFNDAAASLSYFRQGGLSVHEWRDSFKGKRELAWFCRDDPVPFLMMCIRIVLRVMGRSVRRCQGRLKFFTHHS
jgi:D-aspartate ligase